MNSAASPPRTEEEIREWLVARLAKRLSVDPDHIDLDAPLTAHGIDSMQFVVLVGELEDWLGCRFTANPLVEYPSVNALSRFLADQLASGKTVICPAQD